MKALWLSALCVAACAPLMQAAEQGSFDRTLSVSGPVDLDVKTDSGGISIRRGSSTSVHVHAILKGNNGWFSSEDVRSHIQELGRNPPIEQEGNRIRIGYVRHAELLRNVSIRFEIDAPYETQLHAGADSGGIDVRDLRGPVDCKTDSGGIRVEHIDNAVRAAADSGGIRVNGVKGSLYARADSGGIEALGVEGSIDAQADSGSVTVAQTRAAPIHAKADSGGVHVTLAPGAGYDVTASTDSGRISHPAMSTETASSSHHLSGKIGGGGPAVSLSVESGSISID